MRTNNGNKKNHVIFEPIKDFRHLIKIAEKEKREVLQVFFFILIFALTVFSFRQTIYIIQAAENSKNRTRGIEENHSQYVSQYNTEGCMLKEGEEMKFSDNPRNVLKCEEFFDDICSICGKTDKELALEEKANREYQIRVEREKEKARQAAALTRKRAAAPVPAAGNKVGDHWVCDKKNDKPRESKENHNGMHWDRECCLDPDEWPNPWCAY